MSPHSSPYTFANDRMPPSSINLSRLASFLSSYQDQRLAAYIVSGIRDGFRIGVSCPCTVCSSSRNHPSCLVSPSVVGTYLSSKQSAGHMLGSVQHSEFLPTSPIVLVPKGYRGDAWRMIIDLSHPTSQSVNDFIPSDLCSHHYPSVDDTIDFILELGRYTQLMMIDLKNAYHVLPIHREDRQHLGMRWEGGVCVDLSLPLACARP